MALIVKNWVIQIPTSDKSNPPLEVRADFSVKPGERLALMGKSGCGKSTLLRSIAGLIAEDWVTASGQMELNGKSLRGVAPEFREIGFLFQDHALFPTMSVLENAAFGLKVRGVSRLEREKEAHEWLARVGLSNHAKGSVERLRERSIETLSGGERQRLAWVRALIWKPKLLLLDEPFSALDPEMRGELRKELVRLHEAAPVPLIMVTHDEADVSAVATQAIRVYSPEQQPHVRVFRNL